MGDVTEFRPKKDDEEESYLYCTDCGNAFWLIYTNGEMVCPLCGVYTTLADEF